MAIRQFLSFITILTLLLSSLSLQAKEQTASQAKSVKSKKSQSASHIDPAIVKKAETIKKNLIKLNRELYQFEDDLLYPTNTQLAVFLSITEKTTFNLDSVELRLDNHLVASYIYKSNELRALRKGGIQRIYLGSLSDGKHKLTAQFNGQNSSTSYFRKKKAFNFTKEHKAKFIQMVVSENKTTGDPLFKVKLW